jgi:hypothetical protein
LKVTVQPCKYRVFGAQAITRDSVFAVGEEINTNKLTPKKDGGLEYPEIPSTVGMYNCTAMNIMQVMKANRFVHIFQLQSFWF